VPQNMMPTHNHTGVGDDVLRDGNRIAYTNCWTWYAAAADQGLLYYYTKYYAKDTSLLFGEDQIENWHGAADEEATLQKYDTQLLSKYRYTKTCKDYAVGIKTRPQHHFYEHCGGKQTSRTEFKNHQPLSLTVSLFFLIPLNSYFLFFIQGGKKPWAKNKLKKKTNLKKLRERDNSTWTTAEIWWMELEEVAIKLNFVPDFNGTVTTDNKNVLLNFKREHFYMEYRSKHNWSANLGDELFYVSA
jgi:hypothetical protein